MVYISAKRNLFDLKVFIEPEESLRLHWKISRDIQKRDYTKEKVLYQLRLREEDSNKYIRSQAPLSDIKVAYYAIDDIADIGNGEDVELALRVELETNIDINDLLDKLRDYPTLQIAHDYGVSNQLLNVRGTILSSEIKESTYGFIGDYDEFIEDVVFQNDLNGFLQLFFVYCIVYKAKNKS